MKLFGIEIPNIRAQKYPEKTLTVSSKPDGTAEVTEGNGSSIGNAVLQYDISKLPPSEFQRITKYRQLAMDAEVAEAIQEIVNETFNIDQATLAFRLHFSEDTQISAGTQKKINEALEYVYHDLFDFDGTGKELFRSWYIDSRLFIHKVIGKDKKTIAKLQSIDALKMRRVRKIVVDENGLQDLGKEVIDYFYNPESSKDANRRFWEKFTQNDIKKVLKFPEQSIAYTDSHIVDADEGYIIGYLNAAILPFNNMKMMEDAMVIYRIVRAPERRIFYVDVADMPKQKAEQYMADMIAKFKNKTVYNNKSGEVVDRRHIQSMLEDIWLPRRSNGRSTEVSTLEGGQNLGVTEDVEYTRNKFLRSLKVPHSRFDQEQTPFGTNRLTEITRDEYRFTKFIQELRGKYMIVVEDVLMTELVLRNIISQDEWKAIKRDFRWVFAEDNDLVELKQNDILNGQIEMLNTIEPYIGKYFSPEWALQRALKFTDADIDKQQKKIEEYRKKYPNMFEPTEAGETWGVDGNDVSDGNGGNGGGGQDSDSEESSSVKKTTQIITSNGNDDIKG